MFPVTSSTARAIGAAVTAAATVRGVGWLRRHSRTLQIVGGLTLVVVGLALLTGAWDVFVAWIRDEFVTAVVLPI